MEPQVDRIEVDMTEATPPPKNRPTRLDPDQHAGEYAPEPALLEILANLGGAASWRTATAGQRALALARDVLATEAAAIAVRLNLDQAAIV